MKDSDKNTSLIRNSTLFFGGFLLFTDVFFLIIGIVYQMPIFRYVVYVKMVLNTTNIFIILKKHYLIATSIIYTVILGFMITGVVCTGPRPAFQIFALGMLPCISYIGYLHKRMLNRELPFAPLITIHTICYAIVYLYARFFDPLYAVPQSAVDILVIFNSIATFGIVILFITLFHNVTISSEEKLEKMALVDNLTGLYNRHYLLAALDHMEIQSQEDCWLALLDIDDFKKVNDTYGHNCGDYVLRQIAGLAKQTCRDCTVCRWGGEEFIILSTKRECSTDLLEALRRQIHDETLQFENSQLQITVTIGIARYDSRLSIDGWISKADEKLYLGKNTGKNRVVS